MFTLAGAAPAPRPPLHALRRPHRLPPHVLREPQLPHSLLQISRAQPRLRPAYAAPHGRHDAGARGRGVWGEIL